MKAKTIYFSNREKLLNYVEQSKSPELKQFIDNLLVFERWKENRPQAKLSIDIGKAEFENGKLIKFYSNLSSRTDNPTVFIDSFDNVPLIAIQDESYHNDTIALLDLTDITDLKINESTIETATYFDCTFHSSHNNLDYMIYLKVTK